MLYLWYPAPGPEAVEHADEIRRFQQIAEACQPRINFRAIAYPGLIHALARSHGDVHGAYNDYLMERYF